MARKAVPRAIRRQVRDRANIHCEYCHHPADYSTAPYICDHIQPRVRGADSSLPDLAWSCPACNGHKYSNTHAPDPRTGRLVPLFSPRRQRWSRHFKWSADFLFIHGRTGTGRATVAALHLLTPV